MIYKYIFFLCFLSNIYASNSDFNNSIFMFSKGSIVNSLGNSLFLSDNASDIFSNPSNFKNNANSMTFFSNFSIINESINIKQFSCSLFKNYNTILNFGLIQRLVTDNYNTSNAWNSIDGILDFNDIEYDNIYSFSDSEVGLIFSYNRQISNSLLNIMIKPIFHSIDITKANGINLDIYISKSYKNLNFIFGFNNYSYKKWNNGILEQNPFEPIISLSYKSKKIFFVSNFLIESDRYGLAYNMTENFILRLGIDEHDNFSYGFGANSNLIQFNYSYFRLPNMKEFVNQIGISINIRKVKEILQ